MPRVLAQLAGEECAKAHLLLSLLILKVAGLNLPMESFWAWFSHGQASKTFVPRFLEHALVVVIDPAEPAPRCRKRLGPRMDEWLSGIACDGQASWHRQGRVGEKTRHTLIFGMEKVYVPKKRISRIRAERRIAQATAEVARVKEITDAQLGALIQMPDAVEFLRRAVAAMGKPIATMAEPSEP